MSQVDAITIASKQRKSADWSNVTIGIYTDTMRHIIKCVSLFGFLENCILARVQHNNTSNYRFIAIVDEMMQYYR